MDDKNQRETRENDKGCLYEIFVFFPERMKKRECFSKKDKNSCQNESVLGEGSSKRGRERLFVFFKKKGFPMNKEKEKK